MTAKEKSIDTLLEELQDIIGQLQDRPTFDGIAVCVLANSDVNLMFSETMAPHAMIGLLETAKWKILQDFIGEGSENA